MGMLISLMVKLVLLPFWLIGELIEALTHSKHRRRHPRRRRR